jgi:hypothetical protein
MSPMSNFCACRSVNGPAEFLKSFGRRRRTKVLDERTRGEQGVYGEFGSELPLGFVWQTLRRGWRVAPLWQWCAVYRFLLLEWWSKSTIGSQFMTLGTSWAIGRGTVTAAGVWCSRCRVTGQSSRLVLADAAAPSADTSGRTSR